jgi:nicotinate phosphoribosyltransferase
LRQALVENHLEWVRITVSSGFTAPKIDEWTKEGVPVDMYGVGSALVLNGTVGFTGDLVKLDGALEAKEGRADVPSDRLKAVPFPIH